MSIFVMSLVWEKANVAGNDLVVLLALADWSNDRGLSWHSVPNIARKAHVSERTVQRCLETLESLTYVKVERRGDIGKPSLYHINTAYLMESGEGGDNMTSPSDGGGGGGDNSDGLGVTTVTPRGDNSDTQYVIETKEETKHPYISPHAPEASNALAVVPPSQRPVNSTNGPDTGSYAHNVENPPERWTLSAILPMPLFIKMGKKPATKLGSLPPDSIHLSPTSLSYFEKEGWRGDGAHMQARVNVCLDWHKHKGTHSHDWDALVGNWIRRDIKEGDDLPNGAPATRQRTQSNGHGQRTGTGANPAYGYNAHGEPTNKATQLRTTAERLAEKQRQRGVVEQVGEDASSFSDADWRGPGR